MRPRPPGWPAASAKVRAWCPSLTRDAASAARSFTGRGTWTNSVRRSPEMRPRPPPGGPYPLPTTTWCPSLTRDAASAATMTGRMARSVGECPSLTRDAASAASPVASAVRYSVRCPSLTRDAASAAAVWVARVVVVGDVSVAHQRCGLGRRRTRKPHFSQGLRLLLRAPDRKLAFHCRVWAVLAGATPVTAGSSSVRRSSQHHIHARGRFRVSGVLPCGPHVRPQPTCQRAVLVMNDARC